MTVRRSRKLPWFRSARTQRVWVGLGQGRRTHKRQERSLEDRWNKDFRGSCLVLLRHLHIILLAKGSYRKVLSK